MRALDESESLVFLQANHLGVELTHIDPKRVHMEFTRDVGRRCAYANLLTNHLFTDEASIVCLAITDWAVWPSSQNMDLFYAYLRSLGVYTFLIEAHFFVFTAAEANVFRNVLHLALISLFDVAGASTTTDFRFYASHDEWIDVLWFEGASWQETMSHFSQGRPIQIKQNGGAEAPPFPYN